MNELVYPHERSLGGITLVLGILGWLVLIVCTLGVALMLVALGFLFYLFAQSALIAHIKGNGVELTDSQFPDLHAQFAACCDKLGIKSRPEVYILNGNGGLNAFATKFLGTQYVVLLSDVVDAMSAHDDGVRFYLGHELGHLRMKHLSGHFLRWPALWLPLLGAAYSRARESTCDRHGLACCGSPEGAARALAALSAGVARWKDIDLAVYGSQVQYSTGFWMSFHELILGYPWLSKRVARVMDTPIPKRNGFAYLIAIWLPYSGRSGGFFGALVLVYLVGILAAIGLPAYQEYTARAKLTVAIRDSQDARDALGNYYQQNQKIPASLAEIAVAHQIGNGTLLSVDPRRMVLTVKTPIGELIFTPRPDDNGRISWDCSNGDGIKPAQLPPACRGNAGR